LRPQAARASGATWPLATGIFLAFAALPASSAGQSAADLSITKTDGVSTVNAGSNTTYTVVVTNNGPDDAGGLVEMVDDVPANTTFVSAMQTAGSLFTLTTPPVGGTGTIIATSAAAFPAGDSAIFQITVNVTAGTPGGTFIVNSAQVSSPIDPNEGNNVAFDLDTVASADLFVTKTDGVSTLIAGSNTTYTVVLTNNGPDAAQNVTLTDSVPANTTFVSAMQTGGPVFTLTTPPVGSTGTVTATAAALTAGTTATFQITVKVDGAAAPGTTITNTATAASATSDPNPGNNSATDADTVVMLTVSPSAVPTLSERGLTLLGLALALAAVALLRRR
jgi:uncharacterized repeat protein (TIGR01451 family)